MELLNKEPFRAYGVGGGQPAPVSRLALFSRISGLILGAFLLWVAIGKLIRPAETLIALEWGFDADLSRPFFLILVIVEITLGGALLAGLRSTYTLAALAGLLSIFLGWIGYLIVSDAPVPCGCGTDRRGDDGHWGSLTRTGLLLAWTGSALCCAVIAERAKSRALGPRMEESE